MSGNKKFSVMLILLGVISVIGTHIAIKTFGEQMRSSLSQLAQQLIAGTGYFVIPALCFVFACIKSK